MFAMAPEGAEILAAHPNLLGWLARIEARPARAGDDLGPAVGTGEKRATGWWFVTLVEIAVAAAPPLGWALAAPGEPGKVRFSRGSKWLEIDARR